MPSGDYSSTISGGLKLKGGAKDAGIKKKKKSSKKKEKEVGKEQEEAGATPDPAAKDPAAAAAASPLHHHEGDADAVEPTQTRSGTSTAAGSGKTETQLRHEEIKRKRLDERLKREGGAKTHKQRVEELNKYLSTLSEHHDMPRIGPG